MRSVFGEFSADENVRWKLKKEERRRKKHQQRNAEKKDIKSGLQPEHNRLAIYVNNLGKKKKSITMQNTCCTRSPIHIL